MALSRWSKVLARFAVAGQAWLLVLCLASGPTLVGCDISTGGRGEGPGRRPQELALSPQQELELGRQAYRQVLTEPRKFGRPVPPDRPECQRVRGIAEAIIHASQIEPLRREINLRKDDWFEWRVNVFDKDDINAFCLPGGKMVVFRGLLRVVQNDDQIATVLSHEIAHALAHHSSERVARDEINHGVLGGIWSKSFERGQETEADHIGLFLMTFAEYKPDEAVRFWERMQKASGRHGVPEILSDHPSDARRIESIREWIPNARAAKRAYDEGRIAPPRGR